MSDKCRDNRTLNGKRSLGARQSFNVHICRAEEAFREATKGDMAPVEFQNYLANYYMLLSAECAAKLCQIQRREPNIERFTNLAEAAIGKYIWKGEKILRYVVKFMDSLAKWEEVK